MIHIRMPLTKKTTWEINEQDKRPEHFEIEATCSYKLNLITLRNMQEQDRRANKRLSKLQVIDTSSWKLTKSIL